MRNRVLGTGQQGYRPIRKLRVILQGLRYALADFSVAYKLVLSVLVLILCFIWREWLDVGLILVTTAMMVMAEMFNTTIEALCDFVEERENPKIGVIKDIGAAATGIAIFVWVAVVATEATQLLRMLL